MREGMNNDVVKSIVEDKNGNLWFTTEIGLSCFNKATEQFRNLRQIRRFPECRVRRRQCVACIEWRFMAWFTTGILTFSPDKLETQHTPTMIRVL